MATTSLTPSGNGGYLLPAGYLSTKGSQIVDADGNAVRIASIGWNQGFDNIPASVAAMRAAGFNTIRVSWVDATMANDLQTIDKIVAAATANGMKVILDHHTNEPGSAGDWWGAQQQNGLPYDQGGASNNTNGAGLAGTVTLAQFQQHWVQVAQRYAGNATVIGFDLDNEPLEIPGGSTWGTGDPNTDLQMIYSNVGKAIQAVNPGALIIAEGAQNYSGNMAGTTPAPWGDLSVAGAKPVTLTIPNKVVYSVHDYPKAISGISYDSGSTAVTYMNNAFGYLVTQNIAPVWIGEMGGSLDGLADSAGDNLAGEQAWAKTLLDYMNGKYSAQGGPSVGAGQQGMSGDWWAWGNLAGQYPDGVLNADGSLKAGQKAVWSQMLFTNPAQTPVPTSPPSVDNTVVTNTTGKIVDAHGNTWTITAAGQVAVNGTPDTTTSNVVELAYEKGLVWQENSAKLWWSKSLTTDAWGPSAGTATSPVPTPTATPTPTPTPKVTAPPVSADNTVVTNTTGKIVDAHGNTWTITAAGQVAVNGTPDTTTSNVVELAYEKGLVWQENSAKLWWSKSLTTDAWGPSAGTATSPVPTPTPTATPTPTPTAAPAAIVIGSGSDRILLAMSQDPDGPLHVTGRDAQFTVNVDGKQIGGLRTATATHALGKTQLFEFDGNFGPGTHNIVVTFANNSMTQGDKGAFNDGGDRNLYVDSLTYDGVVVKSTPTGIYTSPGYPPFGVFDPGNAVFTVTDTTAIPANAPSSPTTTPGAVSVGAGADTVMLKMSEDPYQGDAQFTVAVDGKQVGGTLTTRAISWQGQTQEFDVHGNWGTGKHTVAVTFLNDAIGPVDANGNAYDATDRNLYINGLSYNGIVASGTPWELASNGTQTFSVTGSAAVTAAAPAVVGTTASPTVTVTKAQQADAELDGSQVATTTVGDDTFSLLGHGAARVALGSANETIRFAGMANVSVAGGTGQVTLTADAGQNSFTAGGGALEITGGSGADAYVFHATSGMLTIDDFAAAKGDSLTIDTGLKGSMLVGSDGHGGGLISFGAATAGTIDLRGIATLPTAAIHLA